ncbi:DNA helicase [Striga asiatica]|uniref:DNA helicase n=1 Tax=Striga asiatica TaxID=4170 RepID=A0A5A7PLH5_STRAF|nr:DNA helicase [Striga asiatica]
MFARLATGQRMRMVNTPVLAIAGTTHIVIWAGVTAPPLASLYVQVAHSARSHKCWGRGVVKMVQYHHRRVLGSPEGVILVVVALTQAEERLSRVKEFTLYDLVVLGVIRDSRYFHLFSRICIFLGFSWTYGIKCVLVLVVNGIPIEFQQPLEYSSVSTSVLIDDVFSSTWPVISIKVWQPCCSYLCFTFTGRDKEMLVKISQLNYNTFF